MIFQKGGDHRPIRTSSSGSASYGASRRRRSGWRGRDAAPGRESWPPRSSLPPRRSGISSGCLERAGSVPLTEESRRGAARRGGAAAVRTGRGRVEPGRRSRPRLRHLDDERLLRRPGDRGADAHLRPRQPPAGRVSVSGGSDRAGHGTEAAGGAGGRQGRAGTGDELSPFSGLRTDRPRLRVPRRGDRREPGLDHRAGALAAVVAPLPPSLRDVRPA